MTSGLIQLMPTRADGSEGILSTPCNTLHNTSDIRPSYTHSLTGGIDALAVRVHCTASFAESFYEIRREISKRRGAVKKSRYYRSETDLCPYSISAVLHEGLYGNPYGEHKLELKGVGKMSTAEIRREITEIFDVDPDSLAVMRVDLYADAAVPMNWFQTHAYVKWKRSSRTYGKADVETEVKSSVKTITLGSGSNLFRFYDKAGLWGQEYAKAIKLASGIEIPSFASIHGCEGGDVVTRVEHQLRGRSVPEKLRTVGSLFANAAEFDPFNALKLLSGGKPEPDVNAYKPHEYLCGMGARSLIEKHGLAEFRAFLNRRAGNNAAKIIRKYEDFIPSDERFAAPDLTAIYRCGVREQLLRLASCPEAIPAIA
jgi:hypothetical protein